MYQSDISERIMRILIFMLLSFIILRFLIATTLSDIEQIKITAAVTVCFMFVNTYYPVVITKDTVS